MKKVQIGETLFLNKSQDVNAAQIFCKEENYVVPPADADEKPTKKLIKAKKNVTYEEGQTVVVLMYQACFSSKEGEVVFSDKFESLEPVVNIVESLGLDKVLEDLYLRKENVHTASLYTKDEKLKVAVNFKFGTSVFAGPFDNSENAVKFIQDQL